jgi:hypothetical protein
MAVTAFAIILSFNDLENCKTYGNNVLKTVFVPFFTITVAQKIFCSNNV